MSGRDNPKLSVVIVNYLSEEHLSGCLRSLQTQGTSAEIILVDNGSRPELRKRIEREFPACRWIRMDGNKGFSVAANRGAAAASSGRLLFLNPDTTVEDGSLPRLVEALDSEALRNGIAGCKVLDEDGGVQLSCRRFPDWRAVAANRFSLLTRLWPANSWSVSYLMSDFDHRGFRRVDWVSGAAMAMRSDVFRRLGGFAEEYFLYFEDVDLCRRARGMGITTWYCPEVRVRHSIGGSSSSAPVRSVIQRHRSMWTYYRKYHRHLLLDPFVCATIAAGCLVKSAGHCLRSAARTYPATSTEAASGD
jgi:GT2 family glycosyltransferase